MAARDLEDTNKLHLLDVISELAWAAATEFAAFQQAQQIPLQSRWAALG
jgi:hypothetical protein